MNLTNTVKILQSVLINRRKPYDHVETFEITQSGGTIVRSFTLSRDMFIYGMSVQAYAQDALGQSYRITADDPYADEITVSIKSIGADDFMSSPLDIHAFNARGNMLGFEGMILPRTSDISAEFAHVLHGAANLVVPISIRLMLHGYFIDKELVVGA
jgi:hypothetical protein